MTTSYNLAIMIAKEIMTVRGSFGDIECHRAQLMARQPDGFERNMGGRNKESIAAYIAPTLDRLITLCATLGIALQDGKNELADEAWQALPDELTQAIETAEVRQREEAFRERNRQELERFHVPLKKHREE